MVPCRHTRAPMRKESQELEAPNRRTRLTLWGFVATARLLAHVSAYGSLSFKHLPRRGCLLVPQQAQDCSAQLPVCQYWHWANDAGTPTASPRAHPTIRMPAALSSLWHCLPLGVEGGGRHPGSMRYGRPFVLMPFQMSPQLRATVATSFRHIGLPSAGDDQPQTNQPNDQAGD